MQLLWSSCSQEKLTLLGRAIRKELKETSVVLYNARHDHGMSLRK